MMNPNLKEGKIIVDIVLESLGFRKNGVNKVRKIILEAIESWKRNAHYNYSKKCN